MKKFCILFDDISVHTIDFECESIEKGIELTKQVFGDDVIIQEAVILNDGYDGEETEIEISFKETTNREAVIDANDIEEAKDIVSKVYGSNTITNAWSIKESAEEIILTENEHEFEHPNNDTVDEHDDEDDGHDDEDDGHDDEDDYENFDPPSPDVILD
jgi:hypothetical protein